MKPIFKALKALIVRKRTPYVMPFWPVQLPTFNLADIKPMPLKLKKELVKMYGLEDQIKLEDE